MPLNEGECRRPTFEGGTPVVLGDGQEWFLAKPRVSWVPHDGPAGFRSRLRLGDDYQVLLDAQEAAEGGAEIIRSELALGSRLLLHNYDLTTDQLATLLTFGYGDDADPADVAVREAVVDVALGIGPKPSAVGGA